MSSPEVSTTLCKHVKGVAFDTVVSAMDFSNIQSYVAEEVEKFVQENGLTDVPHIFMATHSFGKREWEIVEGRQPAFFVEKDMNGGWYIFCEDDVTYLFCSSASSGSSLMAEKQEDGTWNLKLEVPFEEDGQPYQGAYWSAFHEALRALNKEAEAPSLTEALAKLPIDEPLADWERELLK